MRFSVLVLDSVGIGALSDAAEFGDEGSHTLKSCFSSGELVIPHLISLGMGCIEGNEFLPAVSSPLAAYGRMEEKSRGKDTTVGHWELAGLISPKPLPTYPNGFPAELMQRFSEKVGRGWLCNRPASGTEVIRRYGEEHQETGKLIVYTSGDSVFQIAAHEETVPLEELYRICRIAREMLTGEHAVGRVIARPFRTDEAGEYYRTANRRDFSLEPWGLTLPEFLSSQGKKVVGVGKIQDIFASRGIGESYHTDSNAHGLQTTVSLLKEDWEGLLFVNLVDFDSKFGHRNDAVGYARALSELDSALPAVMEAMKEDDVLILCADHGCDPCTPSTDHSREYVPLLVYGKGVSPCALGTRSSFCDLAATVAWNLVGENPFPGTPFWGRRAQ